MTDAVSTAERWEASDSAHLSQRPASAAGKSFAEAAASHIEHGGEARYLRRIVEYFGEKPLAEIFPFDIKQMARALYPDGSNATMNRQALAPARAVMIHAYERGWCGYTRLRRFREDTPKRREPASTTWLHAFIRQAVHDGHDRVAALVLFMATSGARVTEAINLRWSEVDLRQKSVLLLKTKTDRNSLRSLTGEVAARLAELQVSAKPEDRVFGFAHRQSVNSRIRKVCERAGISYKPSHTCGRSSFANNALDMGIDIRSVMEAGGWRSLAIFLGIYVRPHRNAKRIVAESFGRYQYRTEI